MAMTMLQMAGATPTPATMADGILLIIDAQREYTDGLMPLPGVQPAIEALAVLLEKARKAGARSCMCATSPGKAFNPSSSGYEIVAPLAPRAGETIVDKGLPNAFAGTDLVKQLAASGRKNLIVGGFMTHMCVSATVRSATDNGFMSTSPPIRWRRATCPTPRAERPSPPMPSTASRWRRFPTASPGSTQGRPDLMTCAGDPAQWSIRRSELALRVGFALPLAYPSMAMAATATSSISDVYPTSAAPRAPARNDVLRRSRVASVEALATVVSCSECLADDCHRADGSDRDQGRHD